MELGPLSPPPRPLNVGADMGLPGSPTWWLGFHSTRGLFSNCRHKRHCSCGPTVGFSVGSPGRQVSLPSLSTPLAKCLVGTVASVLCSPPLLVLSGILVWRTSLGRSPCSQGDLKYKEPPPCPSTHQTARPSAPGD